jgi:hypothetical protein
LTSEGYTCNILLSIKFYTLAQLWSWLPELLAIWLLAISLGGLHSGQRSFAI